MKPNIHSQRHTAKFHNSQNEKSSLNKKDTLHTAYKNHNLMLVLQNIQFDQANRTTDITQIIQLSK